MNKVLETTNELKDETIRELRGQLIEKNFKIDKLRAKIKQMQGDIYEFVNEFERVKKTFSKNTFLGSAPNQTIKSNTVLT
jgi:uncharacterized coiled-coil protein SlyX